MGSSPGLSFTELSDHQRKWSRPRKDFEVVAIVNDRRIAKGQEAQNNRLKKRQQKTVLRN